MASVSDTLYADLDAYEGTLSDRLFSQAADLSEISGSVSDMRQEAGLNINPFLPEE